MDDIYNNLNFSDVILTNEHVQYSDYIDDSNDCLNTEDLCHDNTNYDFDALNDNQIDLDIGSLYDENNEQDDDIYIGNLVEDDSLKTLEQSQDLTTLTPLIDVPLNSDLRVLLDLDKADKDTMNHCTEEEAKAINIERRESMKPFEFSTICYNLDVECRKLRMYDIYRNRVNTARADELMVKAQTDLKTLSDIVNNQIKHLDLEIQEIVNYQSINSLQRIIYVSRSKSETRQMFENYKAMEFSLMKLMAQRFLIEENYEKQRQTIIQDFETKSHSSYLGTNNNDLIENFKAEYWKFVTAKQVSHLLMNMNTCDVMTHCELCGSEIVVSSSDLPCYNIGKLALDKGMYVSYDNYAVRLELGNIVCPVCGTRHYIARPFLDRLRKLATYVPKISRTASHSSVVKYIFGLKCFEVDDVWNLRVQLPTENGKPIYPLGYEYKPVVQSSASELNIPYGGNSHNSDTETIALNVIQSYKNSRAEHKTKIIAKVKATLSKNVISLDRYNEQQLRMYYDFMKLTNTSHIEVLNLNLDESEFIGTYSFKNLFSLIESKLTIVDDRCKELRYYGSIESFIYLNFTKEEYSSWGECFVYVMQDWERTYERVCQPEYYYGLVSVCDRYGLEYNRYKDVLHLYKECMTNSVIRNEYLNSPLCIRLGVERLNKRNKSSNKILKTTNESLARLSDVDIATAQSIFDININN